MPVARARAAMAEATSAPAERPAAGRAGVEQSVQGVAVVGTKVGQRRCGGRAAVDEPRFGLLEVVDARHQSTRSKSSQSGQALLAK